MPSALARPRLIAIVVCVLSLGCASAPSSSNGFKAPRLASRAVPNLTVPTAASSPSSLPPFRVDIEVAVDPDGSPDMSTFKVTGPGALENRGVLEAWISASRFEPARQDGQPVRGVFKTTIERQVQVRRR